MSQSSRFDFGRELCSSLPAAGEREWLVTNGLGGYAMGTVSGVRTRRYHGLLVAALDPPLDRTLLVAQTDETATYHSREYAIATHRWPDTVSPRGDRLLDRFHLEGTVPVWTYACGDALLEKRVWMAQGEHTTYAQYTLTRGRRPLHLRMKALVNHRDHHATTDGDGWTMDVAPLEKGIRVDAYDGATPFYLRSADANVEPAHNWYRDFYLSTEADRGLDAQEDHLHAATFECTLAPQESTSLVFSVSADASLDGAAALNEQRTHEAKRLEQADLPDAPADVQHLVRAADQFVVDRPTDDDPNGKSIIAGYPWFGDWGRDTMIALPGLTLTTGRPDVAAQILRTYARHLDRGMLPNRFPDHNATPEYNTVDATLWYVEALRAYVTATDDTGLLQELFPVLEEIVDWHERGTRYGIRTDPNNGLLRAGKSGTQLTWMDAKVDDWVVTPRIGKPIEVNALWYNALRSLADFADRLGNDPAPYEERADRVENSFDRFWSEEHQYAIDVIDGPNGDDAQLRPNQIFAVSLRYSPLSRDRQRKIVDTCASALLTPHGLRSLAPTDPTYEGRYQGGREERDGAYHQGTVWGWLLGPFVKAHLRVHEDPATARSFLAPLRRHLAGHGVGQISEIFDGDAPFGPRGTPAQAWSVAQLLEAWPLTSPND
jgi:predicted glycogen debranching enzyme